MAKAKTAAAPKPTKKKAGKAKKAVTLKAAPSGKKKKGAKKSKGAVDALWKLAENPLVGELLAVGATAAVAAIAEAAGPGKKKTVSSRSVKEAGKAAAAAIGSRLISEFTEIKVGSKAKPAKS